MVMHAPEKARIERKRPSFGFSTEDVEVTFFNYTVRQLEDGRWMLENNATGHDRTYLPHSGKLLDTIDDLLAQDIDNGHTDTVATVIVCPRWAAMLYGSGLISDAMLENGRKVGNEIHIPGLVITGRTLTIVVRQRPDHFVATGDKDGTVLLALAA